jgi:hypothetical protein
MTSLRSWFRADLHPVRIRSGVMALGRRPGETISSRSL